MIGHKQTITVANNAILTLPTLSDDYIALVKGEGVDTFLSEVIHATRTLGWPDATHNFTTTGVVIQALSERTARAIFVVDDHMARTNLAFYAAIYAHWGYTLIIDQGTFLCALPLRESPETRHPVDPTTLPEAFCMEVA
jgi:hypothetical protein